MEELVIHVDVPVPPVGRVYLVRGGAGTGKTHALVRRVRELVDAGASPADVLVLCATPDAAARLAERLDVAGVRACCPRELELEILADPVARAHTGRAPRLLTKVEREFLREDLKVGGTQTKRLGQILAFFDRSFTELADEDPKFLIDGDEIDAMERLKTTLAMTGGVLECELPELAVRCVRDMPELRGRFAREHVLVDDYQLLCRASQLLASFLATETLWAAGDPNGCVEVFERFPYAAGLEEFASGHPGCETTDLAVSHASAAVAGVLNALSADEDVAGAALEVPRDAPRGRAEAREYPDASAELRGVIGLIRDALDRGVAPGEVFVWAPNALWARNVGRALGLMGIASSSAFAGRIEPEGSIADEQASAQARAFTLLCLAGDPGDGVAWRGWCGFGSYLGRSGAFDILRDYGDRHGQGLIAMLDLLAGDEGRDALGSLPFHEDMREVLSRYQLGRALLARLAGLPSAELLPAIARAVTDDEAECDAVTRYLGELCAISRDDGDGPDLDATKLRSRALLRLASLRPAAASVGGDAVAIGGESAMVGRNPRIVICCGFVDGFIPRRDFFETTKTVPGKVHARRAQALRRAALLFGKARGELACTCPASIELALAGRLDLKIERVYIQDGKRMAALSPSIVLRASSIPTVKLG